MRTGSEILESIAKRIAEEDDTSIVTYCTLSVPERSNKPYQLSYTWDVDPVRLVRHVESYLPDVKGRPWEVANGVLFDNSGSKDRRDIALEDVAEDNIHLRRYGPGEYASDFLVPREPVEEFFAESDTRFIDGSRPLMFYTIESLINFQFMFPRIRDYGSSHDGSRLSDERFVMAWNSDPVFNKNMNHYLKRVKGTFASLERTTGVILDHSESIEALVEHLQDKFKSKKAAAQI